MDKKLCFGLVVALAGLYGMQGQTQAANPLVGFPSTTTVKSLNNPQEVGQPVTFTVTVTASSSPSPAPSPAAPSGKVDFSDDGTLISECSGAQAVVLVTGTGSCTHPFVTAGSHVITAKYEGDTVYQSSTGTLASGESITATPSTFSLGSQTASPYPSAVYSGGSAGPIPTDNPAPASFTPLPTSVTESTIPYQPTLSPSSTAPGSGSNLLAIVVIIVVVLLIISAGAITLLLVVK